MATNTEVEIIKFEGDLSDLKKDLKTAEQSFSNLETKGKTAAKNTEQSFSRLGSSVKSVLQNLPFGSLISDLEQASDQARNVGGAIGDISNQSSKAGSGVKALTGLIGVGLLGSVTLVAAGIASVISFLKQTDEGAAQLEATFNGLSAATDVLSGKFSQLGGDIVETLSESEGFGSVLKGTLLAGLNAVVPGAGLAAKAIGKSGLAQDMKDAYNQAYELTIQLDAIQDEMRLLSVETKQTDLQIQALLKQAKNRGIDVTERIGLIAQAQDLENANLQKNFELQKRYYDNIAQTNLLKLESINSENKAGIQRVRAITDQIKQAETADELLNLYREQIKAQEGLVSISDDLAQVQVDGLKDIVELSGRSEVLAEKYAALTSALIEKDIAERTEAIKVVEREREAAAINTIKDEQALAKATLDIRIMALQQQKELLQSYGKDVSQIDLDIANLRKKYEEDSSKKLQEELQKRLAYEKQYYENKAKQDQANFNLSIKNLDEDLKSRTLAIRSQSKDAEQIQKEELEAQIENLEHKRIILQNAGQSTLDIDLEVQAKKKQLYDQDVKDYSAAQAKKKQATIQALDFTFSQTEAIFNGLAQNQQARTQQEIANSQNETQQKQKNLQAQLDAGLISQAKYDASVRINQDKQAKYEQALKARQAKSDKQNALFNIAINTAASIAKTLATLGVPAGIPASLLAAAAGAAQYAIVNARPLPKYKEGVIDIEGPGTSTSDSITAKLSKGESVMTADETKENLGLLWAIRNNKLDDYVNRAWVKPALDKQDEIRMQKEQRYNKMMRRAINKNNETDTSEMERLLRKNKDVRIANWHEMPNGKGRSIV